MDTHDTGRNTNDNSNGNDSPDAGLQPTASNGLSFMQPFRSKNRSLLSSTSKATRVSKSHVPIDANELEDNYRIMPLVIGCIIPASILINVPSLTSEWVGLPVYDSATEKWGPPVEVPIPHWMSGMVIAALVMAIICNVCVLSRFLERNVWHSVVLSLITASLQGYVYLEGFWSMVASLSFSATATVLISIDLHRTPQFHLQGSGVTHKQRMLIAQAMAFCFYLAIGALIFIWIEEWTFLDSLFFAMITITTIGFGDIVPKSTGGRVFVVFYASGGIVIFAMAVNAIRYVILEDLHRQFAIRAQERKAKKEARMLERREERLRELEKRKGVQEAVQNIQRTDVLEGITGAGVESHQSSILQRNFTMPSSATIRLPAIFHRQGSAPTPMQQRIPSITFTDFSADETSPRFDTINKSESAGSVQIDKPADIDETTRRLSPNQGPVVGKDTHAEETQMNAVRRASARAIDSTREGDYNHHQSFPKGLRELVVRWCCMFGRACGFKEAANCAIIAAPMSNLKKQREADKKLAYKESMQEYRRRLRFSFAIFMCFWLVGAAIHQALEPWTYGQAMYFSFIAFSSIGYGDLVPLSLAGRAIFLAYCLIGVVTLTSLASLISEVLNKSLRRHVVQAQLRRSELSIEQAQDPDRRANNIDLEQVDVLAEMVENERSSEEGRQEERMQTLRTLASSMSDGHADSSRNPDAYQGSLTNLVQVSRDFDTLLQRVLGLDYGSSDHVPTATATSNAPESKPQAQVPLGPENILDYLEKEEEELINSSCFSPSISRDITSTSTIRRNSVASLGRYSMDLKSTGTYHGVGSSTASVSSSSLESEFDTNAWPKASSTASTKIHSDNERLTPLQKQPTPPRLTTQTVPQPIVTFPTSPTSPFATAKPPPVTTHRHNHDGSVTISAIHWKHLIEYSKQFRTLTDSCDEALQKLLAWKVAARKMRMRRKQVKERQRRLLQARRRWLFEMGGTYGAIDDGIEDEDELEYLHGWFEEGSNTDEDDGYEEDDEGLDTDELDQDQEGIARTLLGTIDDAAVPQTRRSRVQAQRVGASVHVRPRRSRSRSPVATESTVAQQYEGETGIGAISETREASVDNHSNMAADSLTSANERVPSFMSSEGDVIHIAVDDPLNITRPVI
ncbi:hypothetical protein BGW39_007983 [Mortierella sp. 14UC]|nr:hypothetical protein BGW39_007983 [Mortierella sp. 14UC]